MAPGRTKKLYCYVLQVFQIEPFGIPAFITEVTLQNYIGTYSRSSKTNKQKNKNKLYPVFITEVTLQSYIRRYSTTPKQNNLIFLDSLEVALKCLCALQHGMGAVATRDARTDIEHILSGSETSGLLQDGRLQPRQLFVSLRNRMDFALPSLHS